MQFTPGERGYVCGAARRASDRLLIRALCRACGGLDRSLSSVDQLTVRSRDCVGCVFGTVIVRDRLERVRAICHVIANHQIWDMTYTSSPSPSNLRATASRKFTCYVLLLQSCLRGWARRTSSSDGSNIVSLIIVAEGGTFEHVGLYESGKSLRSTAEVVFRRGQEW